MKEQYQNEQSDIVSYFSIFTVFKIKSEEVRGDFEDGVEGLIARTFWTAPDFFFSPIRPSLVHAAIPGSVASLFLVPPLLSVMYQKVTTRRGESKKSFSTSVPPSLLLALLACLL